MSEYTVQLKWIIESMTADMVGQPIVSRIEAAAKKIFDFDYPIWSEDYRATLEQKILMRYFNKEIGMETVGLWKFYLNERLNRIMPYYNQLYASVIPDYDFTQNVNMNETFSENEKEDVSETSNENTNSGRESTTTGNMSNTMSQTENVENNGTVNDSGTTSNTRLTSDLPQANYAGVDYGTGLVEDNGTSSNDRTTHDETERTVNETQTSESTDNLTDNAKVERDSNRQTGREKGREYGRNQKGHNIPIQELIMKYRDTLINIDNMIIGELSDLFMTIY